MATVVRAVAEDRPLGALRFGRSLGTPVPAAACRLCGEARFEDTLHGDGDAMNWLIRHLSDVHAEPRITLVGGLPKSGASPLGIDAAPHRGALLRLTACWLVDDAARLEAALRTADPGLLELVVWDTVVALRAAARRLAEARPRRS